MYPKVSLLARFVAVFVSVCCLVGCSGMPEANLPRPTPVPTIGRLPSVTLVPPATATLPATATSPATKTPVPVVGVVNITANVRLGPGTSFDIVGSLQVGTEVLLIQRDENWYQIRTIQSGLNGWMIEDVLDIAEDQIERVTTVVPES
jgi:hypothetical protein